jgi:hypothetical protein
MRVIVSSFFFGHNVSVWEHNPINGKKNPTLVNYNNYAFKVLQTKVTH